MYRDRENHIPLLPLPSAREPLLLEHMSPSRNRLLHRHHNRRLDLTLLWDPQALLLRTFVLVPFLPGLPGVSRRTLFKALCPSTSPLNP